MSKVIWELENDTNFLNITSPEHPTFFKPAKRKTKPSENVLRKNRTSTRNINSSKVSVLHSSSKKRRAVFVENTDKDQIPTGNHFSKVFGSSRVSVIFSPPKKSNVYVKNIAKIEETSRNTDFSKVFESSQISVLDTPLKKGTDIVKKAVKKYKTSTGSVDSLQESVFDSPPKERAVLDKKVGNDNDLNRNSYFSKTFQSSPGEKTSQEPTNSSFEKSSLNLLTEESINESTPQEHSRILFDQLEKCIAVKENDFLNTLRLSTVSSSDNLYQNISTKTANLSQQWFNYSEVDNSSKLVNSKTETTFSSTFSSSILSACKLKRKKNASQKKSKTVRTSSVNNESSYFSVSKVSEDTKLPSKRTKRKSNLLPSKLKSKLPPFDQFCNTNFYNYLIEKIEPKFGVYTNQEVVKLVKFITDIVKETSYSKKDPNENVNLLKKTLFEYGVVVTHYDFNLFCLEYLPIRFRNKAIPMGKSSSVEVNPHTLFEPIA